MLSVSIPPAAVTVIPAAVTVIVRSEVVIIGKGALPVDPVTVIGFPAPLVVIIDFRINGVDACFVSKGVICGKGLLPLGPLLIVRIVVVGGERLLPFSPLLIILIAAAVAAVTVAAAAPTAFKVFLSLSCFFSLLSALSPAFLSLSDISFS